jgi:hypothetical protein
VPILENGGKTMEHKEVLRALEAASAFLDGNDAETAKELKALVDKQVVAMQKEIAFLDAD